MIFDNRNSVNQQRAAYKVRSQDLSQARGFTLIEIMIVMVIIGAVMVSIISKFGNRNGEMRAAVRQLGATMREAHNTARLFNSTYRLVLKIEGKEEHSYLYESSTGTALLLTADQEKELQKLSKEEAQKRKEQAGFAPDGRIMKKPAKLPQELIFEEIEYGNRASSITEGEAYVYFFPQGLAEEAVIHISDRTGQLHWTLALNPITGGVNIFDKNIRLKELRSW